MMPSMVTPQADATGTPYACDVCSDTGFVERIGVDLVRRAARCGCRPTWAEGVPREFQSARWATWRETPGTVAALRVARGWLAGTRDLYICGGIGAGKTRLACTILNEARLAGTVGWFARVPWLLYQLQPGQVPDETRHQLEGHLARAQLACLDDVGAERDQATDYTRRTLLLLYEARGDAGLRTIWTSNLTPGELVARGGHDPRLASRLAGRCDVVRLTEADQRVRGKR